jgi:hypothetical protein
MTILSHVRFWRVARGAQSDVGVMTVFRIHLRYPSPARAAANFSEEQHQWGSPDDRLSPANAMAMRLNMDRSLSLETLC